MWLVHDEVKAYMMKRRVKVHDSGDGALASDWPENSAFLTFVSSKNLSLKFPNYSGKQFGGEMKDWKAIVAAAGNWTVV